MSLVVFVEAVKELLVEEKMEQQAMAPERETAWLLAVAEFAALEREKCFDFVMKGLLEE